MHILKYLKMLIILPFEKIDRVNKTTSTCLKGI
jgi:hypothetical protein